MKRGGTRDCRLGRDRVRFAPCDPAAIWRPKKRGPLRAGLAIAAAVMLFAAGCTGSSRPSQIQSGFDSVRPGHTTDAEALSLMGDPAQKTVHNVGGVEMQIWQFEDAKATYTLTLGSAAFAGVGARVIAKDMEPKSDR